MQTEVEAKFLNVNHDAVRAALRKIGATLEHPMRTMTRVNMDFVDKRTLATKRGWLRIRNEGNKSTLTYKQLDNWDVNGVQEVETTVSDFAATQQIFEAIGMQVVTYAETRRETWKLGKAEIVLDEWPWVAPFCEIEAKDGEAIRELAEQLGLSWNEATFGSVEPAYQAEYDITDPEFYTINRFAFDAPAPVLLQERKRPRRIHPQRSNEAISEATA